MRDPNKPSKNKPHWPAWFYGPNGAAEIFQSEDDVPAGWEDHPSKVETSDKSATVSEPDFIVPDETVTANDGAKTQKQFVAKRPYNRKSK